MGEKVGVRKEANLALVIVACAVLGIVTAAVLGQLYTDGIIIDVLVSSDISLSDVQFLAFFGWLFAGVVLGALKS